MGARKMELYKIKAIECDLPVERVACIDNCFYFKHEEGKHIRFKIFPLKVTPTGICYIVDHLSIDYVYFKTINNDYSDYVLSYGDNKDEVSVIPFGSPILIQFSPEKESLEWIISKEAECLWERFVDSLENRYEKMVSEESISYCPNGFSLEGVTEGRMPLQFYHINNKFKYDIVKKAR